MRRDTIKTAGTRSQNCCPESVALPLNKMATATWLRLAQMMVETFDLPLAKMVTAHML